jgi:hypothetical protein
VDDSRINLVFRKLVGHRFRDVPVASGTAKYPVILFSVGAG